MREGATEPAPAFGGAPPNRDVAEGAARENARADWTRKAIHGEYHRHVDGLRALAVLPVVFFHLFDTACPGGFTGVDVFFVISGYLICGGIVRDLQAGSFSMVSFYFRRIRRIFAAYFVVVLAVLAAGAALYHWARLLSLAQTALFSACFSANLYFWLITGYFQPNAHGNPLLHLWSLGVEEQFYLTIPLVLLLLWKICRKNMVLVLSLCLAASFALCWVLGRFAQSTTAFYLLPSRGWELLAGALISALRPARGSLAGKLLGWAGIALLAFSYWGLTTAGTFGQAGTSVEVLLPFLGSLGVHPFPGWTTLPAVAGSVLLIRYGNLAPLRRLLCSGPLVGVGKISYSLYLWHWPLIVFAGYLHYDQPLDGWTRSGIVAVSLAVAWLSWRWVEMPIRVSRKFTVRTAFAFAGSGCAVLLALTLVLIGTDGLRHALHRRANGFAPAPYPLTAELDKFLPEPAFRPPPYPGIDPHFFRLLGRPGQPPTFCLLGDSEADALAPGLDVVAAEQGRTGLELAARLDLARLYVGEGTPTQRRRLLEWVAAHPDVRDIYLLGRWMTQYRIEDGVPKLGDKGRIGPVALPAAVGSRMEAEFRRTALWLKRHGKRVLVFSCVPEYSYNPTDLMARSQIVPLHQPIEISFQDYLNRQAPVSEILARLEREGLVKVIPLHAAFFADGSSLSMGPTGIPFYRDGTHVTPEGAVYAVRAAAPLLWPSTAGSPR